MKTKVEIKKSMLIDFLILHNSIPKNEMDEYIEKHNKMSIFKLQNKVKIAFNKNREYGAFKLGSIVHFYIYSTNKEEVELAFDALKEILKFLEIKRDQG